MKQLYYVIKTLLRGRGSNVIKIISLGLGLTMSILLFSRVAFELSYDSCFKDTDNLYQVYSTWSANGENYKPSVMSVGPVAGAILENFPKEVEAATCICRYTANEPLYNGSVRFNETKIMADSLFFKTMGIEVLRGDPRELENKDVIFLSDRLANRIFGDEDPIGKVLLFEKKLPLTVKGIYAALPENTTLPVEGVISMPTMWSRHWGNYSWGGGDSYWEYVRFRKGVKKEAVMARLDAMVAKYLPPEMGKRHMGYTVTLKPLRDTYRSGDQVKKMVWIMSILGMAILFMASLNYVLITISSLSYRAKGIGVHKCNGASGGTIFSMFLLETGIVILLALAIMAVLIVNFQDFVEDTTQARLSSLFALNRLWVPALTVLFLFFIGGVLPGRLFSAIPVSQVFRRYTDGKQGWKRPLLFVQFSGVAFITGLMTVVMAQYAYVIGKDMGYNPDRVAVSYTNFETKEESDYALTFLRGLPYVESVSSAWYPPSTGFSGSMVDANGRTLFSTRIVAEMEDYPVMMGMTFKKGCMAHADDEVDVNETFVKRMRWGTKVLNRVVSIDNETYKVVGLLKDYHTGDFYNEQEPLAVRRQKTFGECIHVRLKEPFVDNLKKLNKEASEAFSTKVIDFLSLEQNIKENYNSVRVFRNATILSAVTLLFIMLMGLIGYTKDEVRRRSKEIAIRKVNGAEVSDVLGLLSKNILYVAVPAVAIGTLVAWYINTNWVDLFAEQVKLSPALYPLVAIAILIVILGCVIWKSWGIANENPVNSIKSE